MPKVVMTSSFLGTITPLNISDVELSAQLHSDDAAISVCPEANIAFIDGSPVAVEDLEELRLALISATASIASGAQHPRSWDSSFGMIEVEHHGLVISINGREHAPSTVLRYAEEIERLMDTCGIRS